MKKENKICFITVANSKSGAVSQPFDLPFLVPELYYCSIQMKMSIITCLRTLRSGKPPSVGKPMLVVSLEN